MTYFDRLAEERLRDAIEAGEFDGLPGRGQPLPLEDLSRVPAELRGGYLLLKGAGCLPEELELRKEHLSLGDLLRACEDDGRRGALRDRRDRLALRIELLKERARRR